MAEHAANNITEYWLEIPAAYKQLLGNIRHWDNLRAAFEGESLWVRDISNDQAESALIKGLPYSKLYYAREGLLFPKGSLLPSGKMPHALWSPLAYAIPVYMPSLNHNYFGISQAIAVNIIQSQQEQPVYAVLAQKEGAGTYITTAPKVRLSMLKWVVVGNELLITGTPLLPVKGRSYWMCNDFLIPCGFEFELPLLAKKFKQKTDPHNHMVILWLEDNTYVCIRREDFMPLSISSFRLTFPA